ncbi:GlcG/HbpS family heme-binding protein [Aeromicrobium sp. P5_D10]
MTNLSLEDAQKVLQATLAKATELGAPSSVAILDSGRELLAFSRQDGALLASTELSQNKAFTAISMQMATGDLGDLVQPGAPLFGLGNAQSRPFVTFGGGVPIVVGGEVVGSVGVAGGSADQDAEAAAAGAAAVA